MTAALNAALALQRFGVGAAPAELGSVSSDPRAYVLSQLGRPEAAVIVDAQLPSSAQAAVALIRAQKAKQKKQYVPIQKRAMLTKHLAKPTRTYEIRYLTTKRPLCDPPRSNGSPSATKIVEDRDFTRHNPCQNASLKNRSARSGPMS